MQIPKINNLPDIPMLRTAVYRDLEIEGQTVRVHKPTARKAAMVTQRLMESFGETLLRIFVSPEEDLREVMESSDSSSADMFRVMFAGGFFKKAFERLQELGHDLGPDHIAWYFEHTLVGNIELQGYRFQKLEEMDMSGFGLADMFKLMQVAAELAIYPTSGAPSIGDGSSRPESQPKTQPQAPAETAPPAERFAAATSKAGQSVPMSSQSG